MGSNFFRDLNLGSERSSSSTNNSSKKGKKSSSSDKPKQPQRGLGVAQLEKIRLHSQMGASTYLPPSTNHLPFPSTVSQEDSSRKTSYPSSPSFPYSSSSSSFGFPVQQQSFMMGLNEMANIRYPVPEHQSSPTSRWNHGNNPVIESQYLRQAGITTHFLNQQEEDSLEKRRNEDKSDCMGSSSQDQSSGNQDLDLELRLSL